MNHCLLRPVRLPARGTAAVLVAAAITLAALSGEAAAGTAARPQAMAAPGTPLPPNVRRACPWPPPTHDAACLALVRTDVSSGREQLPDSSPPGYGPASLQDAYNLKTASAQDGKGETVAVVDAYDDPDAESSLAVYRAQYGLPPCSTANGCFTKVNLGQTGTGSPSSLGWGIEESLDIDMVSAICPQCHIMLVEAASDDFTAIFAAEEKAVTLGAKYISNSYGSPATKAALGWDKYYNHPGVVVTAASGDGGYGTIWPSASQYVTAVGGTSLLPASNSRGWDEIAWTGGGSGCSPYEPKPAWQHDSGCANRTVADVSAVADPETGVAVYDGYGQFGWIELGGTSVATPIIASVYALAGPPATGTYPAEYPYEHPSLLYDIVAGTNALNGPCSPAYLCTAGPGYDGPTGWGAPDGPGAFKAG